MRVLRAVAIMVVVPLLGVSVGLLVAFFLTILGRKSTDRTPKRIATIASRFFPYKKLRTLSLPPTGEHISALPSFFSILVA
jgi:hypothetical protein